ncbi:MAG: hypothetical protein BGO32_01230 [Bacteroidetes bacterium 37-13]|nr:MAG: hypothetical protein BGO32_01230 [Bacteroidetes bacterium 37-13]
MFSLLLQICFISFKSQKFIFEITIFVMKKNANLFLILILLIAACKEKDIDKTSVFEGTYVAPVAHSKFDNAIVTKVSNSTFSLQYVLGKSAPFLIIPTVTLQSDSTFEFDLVAALAPDTIKYNVKGDGKIFPNRIVISGEAINRSNSLDFYNLNFEGYR